MHMHSTHFVIHVLYTVLRPHHSIRYSCLPFNPYFECGYRSEPGSAENNNKNYKGFKLNFVYYSNYKKLKL